MLVCKYSKLNSSVFVPHLDTLRSVIMAIRRSGLKVQFSEGFNPHMQLYFNQPLPIGVGSECEYFCAYSSEAPKEFMDKLNKSLPDGVRILKCGKVDKNPNVAKVMYSALYEVEFYHDVDIASATQILMRDAFVINYQAKGKSQSKEVRELIQDVYFSGKKLMLKLRCGNLNLRADRLVNQILADNNVTASYYVIKKDMYTESGKCLDELI